MSTTIRIKNSEVPGKVPASLATSELALNLADEKLYSSKSDGTIFEVGAGTRDYEDLINKPIIGDGTITLKQGTREVASFTVNQVGDTELILAEGAIYTAETGKGIAINASNEIRIGDDWSTIPVLS
jgi:hypothetical protein